MLNDDTKQDDGQTQHEAPQPPASEPTTPTGDPQPEGGQQQAS